jgi:hypothetical protein
MGAIRAAIQGFSAVVLTPLLFLGLVLLGVRLTILSPGFWKGEIRRTDVIERLATEGPKLVEEAAKESGGGESRAALATLVTEMAKHLDQAALISAADPLIDDLFRTLSGKNDLPHEMDIAALREVVLSAVREGAKEKIASIPVCNSAAEAKEAEKSEGFPSCRPASMDPQARADEIADGLGGNLATKVTISDGPGIRIARMIFTYLPWALLRTLILPLLLFFAVSAPPMQSKLRAVGGLLIASGTLLLLIHLLGIVGLKIGLERASSLPSEVTSSFVQPLATQLARDIAIRTVIIGLLSVAFGFALRRYARR